MAQSGSEIKYLGCIWRKSVIFNGGTIYIRRNDVLSEFLLCTVNINYLILHDKVFAFGTCR